jgi:hypothetical protein
MTTNQRPSLKRDSTRKGLRRAFTWHQIASPNSKSKTAISSQ